MQTEFTDTSEPVLIISPSLFGFDALGARITYKGISGILIFESFHRWTIGRPKVGKPSHKLIFPHRWPLVGFQGLSVPRVHIKLEQISSIENLVTLLLCCSEESCLFQFELSTNNVEKLSRSIDIIKVLPGTRDRKQ